MSLQRLFKGKRKAEADRSSLGNDSTPTYTSNNTAAPTHKLPGRDSVRLPDEIKSSTSSYTSNNTTAPTHNLPGRDSETPLEYSFTDTPGVVNYIYYRIYADDGAIPSKIPVAPGDPFLGRIKTISVPPPHTANAVKRRIAKVENINDRISTSLFLTSYSQLPMGDADKVDILNRTGPGSTPQEPLALVAKMSDSERSALESEGRTGLASAAEAGTTTPEIRYLYYLLYANDCEMASKVAIDPEEPSLGRIRTDFVPPPRSLASIKRCISRVERTPELAHADLFADISCDTPLKEGHISILLTDGPGVSPNKPMAIVQMPIVQEESPPIPDGKYVIKNRAGNIYWSAWGSPMMTLHFWHITMGNAKNYSCEQWDITHDANGNISMKSFYDLWVDAEITGYTAPVPWRLIPAGGKFYYLTTDINGNSRNPRVPTAQPRRHKSDNAYVPGSMAILKEGDKWQMWEFIRI